MKYRALDSLGDYTIGKPFLENSPTCVAQAVSTRLKLWKGEYFVNTSDGTPYSEEVLGKRQQRVPESAIKKRILGTPGVTSITAFSSQYDGDTRQLLINATIDTLYGSVPISTAL
jgi:hypothetical protein